MSILCPSPPPAPDYAGAATAQGAANKETAIAQSQLNNPNTYTPYGSSLWEGGTNGDRPTLRQSLSPAEQAKLDASNRIQQGSLGILEQDLPNISQALSGAFGLGGGPQTGYDPRYAPDQRLQTDPNLRQAGQVQGGLDFGGAPGMPQADAGVRDQVSQSIYNQMAHFLDPQFQQKEQALEGTLANQGITRGSEAYNKEQQNLDLAKESAYGDLANRAVTGGGDAMNQLYNMAMQGRQQGVGEISTQGQFGNAAQQQAANELIAAMSARNAGVTGQSNIAAQQQGAANAGRSQAYNEYSTNRTMPINMLSAMLSTSQVNNPQFQATQPSMIQPPPLFGATQAQGQYDTGVYNAKAGLAGNILGGLGKAFGGFMGMP